MKRFAVFLIIASLFILPSCGISEDEMFSEALDIYYSSDTAPKSVGYYVMGMNEGDAGFISSEHFCSLYGKSEECRELSYIENFCIVYSRRDKVREVHIIKAHTESECREIAKMLSLRADAVTKGEFVEEENRYYNNPKSATVTKKGMYSYLVIE